jgi:endo-1,3-1,4-beta-glycanase ExoK
MKFKKLIPLLFLGTLLLSSCSSKDTSLLEKSSTESPKPRELANLYVDFAEGASAHFEAANGWSNGSVFNCTWRLKNIAFENSVMKLTINKDLETSSTPYSGAEYRSKAHYGYGSYEVSMKPIKNDGVVSSFFTYTGPSEGKPWDEIDIEFLGKDTTKVQFNYYTNGKGSNEFIYDLGFDAAEEFHTYGFVWTKDSITWYVDGKAVHTATKDIPTNPGKVMMNVWPGKGVDGWLKPFDGKVPLQAEYKYIKITESE